MEKLGTIRTTAWWWLDWIEMVYGVNLQTGVFKHSKVSHFYQNSFQLIYCLRLKFDKAS